MLAMNSDFVIVALRFVWPSHSFVEWQARSPLKVLSSVLVVWRGLKKRPGLQKTKCHPFFLKGWEGKSGLSETSRSYFATL
jgi:hypothetical protein